MKKYTYILILLLLLLHIQAKGQEIETVIFSLKNFEYKELIQELKRLKRISTKKVEFDWSTSLEREIIDGFFEKVIKLEKLVEDDNNSSIHTVHTHKIKLLTKKSGKICYYKIVRVENVEKGKKWEPIEILEKIDSNEHLINLKTGFQNLYNISLNLNIIFETEIVFGDYCGFAGYPPNYRIKLNTLINTKNKEKLVQWLKSPVVEIQAYAIEGILTLKKTGMSFEQETLNLINLVRKKEGMINTCSGCLYGYLPINGVIENLLKEFNN